MSLNLYIGPMFSGKTTAALRLINTYIRREDSFLCITSNLDTRYAKEGGKIISHNQESHDAVAVDKLDTLRESKAFLDARNIIIEEAHFFPDLKDFVLYAVDVYDKHVTCIGLDGDFERKPFGDLLKLIPFCDSVTKFKGICRSCMIPDICSPYRSAIFTHRISKGNLTQTLVGGATEYESLCRKHYLEAQV